MARTIKIEDEDDTGLRNQFNAWYDSQFDEWYKDYREELWQEWKYLKWWCEVPSDVVEDVFTKIVSAIKDQYGE